MIRELVEDLVRIGGRLDRLGDRAMQLAPLLSEKLASDRFACERVTESVLTLLCVPTLLDELRFDPVVKSAEEYIAGDAAHLPEQLKPERGADHRRNPDRATRTVRKGVDAAPDCRGHGARQRSLRGGP